LQTIRVFGRGPSANELKALFEQLGSDAFMHERRDFQECVQQVIAEARRVGHHFIGTRRRGYALSEVVARL
jgi:hypothetical protein